MAIDKFWRPIGTPNWNSAFNWSPTGVPNSGDVVHFDTFDGTDCTVNTNVNVAGVILDAGYTGVVWLQGTNSFTVGANGYVQHDGTFQCADGTVTFNGPFDQQGGAFSTTLGDHYFNNTVNIAPAAPGFFNDNGGWIIFGGGNNVTLNQSYQLLNVRVQKTGGSVLTLAAGQQITINQQLELITGYVAGPGRLRLFGDGFVGSSMNSSSATLELYGTGSREFKINAFNWGQDVIEITNGANYFFRSDNSTLNILQAGDSLKILLGHAIMDHPNVYLRPNAVFMASSGQFTASSGNTYLERGWINEGSGFNANGGVFYLSAGNNATMDLTSEQVFYDLVCAKSGGANLNLTDNSKIRVSNKYTASSGYLNGSNGAVINAVDSVVINSTYVQGTCPLHFVGDQNGTFIYNSSSNLFSELRIKKDAVNDTVHFETTTSTLNIGDVSSDPIVVEQGTLAFKDYGNHVDWNVVNTTVESNGKFVAPEGTIYFNGNYTANGGSFDHNMGTVRFDNGTPRTWNGNPTTRFYNLRMEKSGGASVTIDGSDQLIVENLMTFATGYLNGPSALVACEKDVLVTNTYVQGNAPVACVGPADGVFTYNSSSNLFDLLTINKDTPSTSVSFGSTNSFLNMGDGVTDPIVIQQGTLRFENFGSHVDWDVFSTTVEPDGTFEAPAGTIYFNGNYTANGGNFEHNMGFVRFNDGSNRSWDGNSSTRFYDLRMEKSGGANVAIQGTDTLIVENLMTISSGYLNGATALLACEKDLTITNTYVQGNAPAAFIGNEASVFTYNSSSNLFDLLTINKDTPGATVSFGSTNTFLNIGDGVTDPIVVERGTLQFDNYGTYVDWDVFSITVESDGSFIAPAGTIYFNGNYTANGGHFDHNMGFVRFNDSANRSWDGNSSTRFYDLRMEKSGGANVVIQGTDSLIVENQMTISSGYLNGPNALLACEKNMTITNTYVQGDAPAAFIGDEASMLTYNSSSNLFDLLTINKDEAQDTVFFGTTNGFLNIGDASVDPILIQRGVLAFQNVGSYVDWDINSTTVEADGTFEAYSGTTYFNGHYTSNGGHFEHNMGEFRFNNSNNRNWNANGNAVFYDLIQEKSGGANVNVGNGDSIIVTNSLTMNSGYLNGNGRIDMRGDVTIGNSHVKGTLDLLFTGTNNTMNNLNTGLSFDTLEVDMGAGQLTFIDGNAGTANSGSTTARYIQRSGNVDFNTSLLTHNWKFLSTTIEDGTFTLPVDDLYVTGSLALLGGSMEGNGGRLIFSGSSNVSAQFEASPQLSYVDFTKSGGAAVTLSGAAPMVVNEILQFLTGYVYDSEIVALGDVNLGNSLNIVSSQVSFNGTTDQNFDLNNSPNKLEGFIEIDKASGNVVLQSNLTIEDNFAQLVLTNGNITMADPSYRVIFGNAVDTGWSGGGNNSFIDGIARKQGTGTLELPIGDNGFWGMITITGVNTTSEYYDAEFHHVDPASAGLVGTLDTGLDHISSCEYWSTTHVGTFSPSVGLSFYEDRCGPINAPADLRVARFESGTWVNEGYSFHDSDEVFASNVDPIMGAFTLASATPSNPMDGSGAAGCPEDFNGDGVVAAADLLELLSQFGCMGSCSADLNGDGQVAAADLLQFLSAFGSSCN
ncbi:GC-type dockerin domain-anchored protein [Sanyastnella coralliicola]|uniref:GC-type dockerin domain-anchored protein n=1 Tax=Sanyastnella coralliicola TaxID=3069118 RepID=UPI0027B970ED|nr:GC-type dockerin domain-anchored protein [Longitalea sp. SCSIO 12813]